MANHPFDLDALRHKTFVTDVVYRDTVESTSDLALSIAASGQHPTGPPLLILAEQQVRGRGRHGRRWESSHGSLTFSLLFTAENSPHPDRLASLSLATALGVSTALSDHSLTGSVCRATLKWPNDVIVDDRKICGILVESTPVSSGPSHHAVVVGVGINVNNRINNDLLDQATSLSDQLGQPVALGDCLTTVLQHIATSIEGWQESLPDLASRWNQASRCIGQPVTVDTSAGITSGICHGVNDSGHLLVEQPDGSLARIASGSIRNPGASSGST